MPLVQFVVGGTSITKVGRVAAELHQGDANVRECPQESIPGLAGRRVFQVMYGDGWDIEKDDVEIIRRDLEKGLNTKAWSATFDNNGRITFYPEQIGLDHLPPAQGNMYEDDPSPGDYAGGDWGEDFDGDFDEDNDGDWDGDWGHGFPEFDQPPHGRGNAYANDYEQSDRYQHTPDPFPQPGRQRNPHMNGFGHGDRYQHSPWPFPRTGRQRNPYTNDFGHSDRYQHIPEPLPRRGGPRSSFSNPFGPRGRYQPTAEPTPRRDNRRSSYANDYDRDYQYEDFSPRYANNNRRRHTFGPEDDAHGRFQRAWGSAPTSPFPRIRGHGTRNEDLEDISRRGFRPPPGMSPARDRDGTPWELSMHNPRNVPRPFHDGLTSIQNSIMYRDAVRGRTQRRSRSGRFWRVVRSFFGHTS